MPAQTRANVSNWFGNMSEPYRWKDVAPINLGNSSRLEQLLRAGKLADARALSNKALALGTPDPRLWFHAGLIRQAQGDATAKELFERALKAQPAFDRLGAEEARRLLGAH